MYYMSNASLAKIQSKMDKERARHEQEVKMLDKIEKTELRLAQRELEEVKRELHALKAYKLVAKQTAFKKFDRLELKKKERREKQRQAREKATNENEAKEEMVSSADGEDEDENNKMAANHQGRRRSSTSGEVFVTLRDILENDDVLRRHSQEIVQRRRASLVTEDDKGEKPEKDSESSKRSRVRTWLNSTTRVSSNNKQDKAMNKGLRTSVKENTEGYAKANALDSENIQNDAEQSLNERTLRKLKGGWVGNLVENVIREDTEAERQEDVEQKEEERLEDGTENVHCDEAGIREVKSLVVSGRKGFKMDKFSNGFFITASHDESESENRVKTKRASTENQRTSKEQLRPMTLFEISKMYEAKKAQKMEENENKLMNLQRRKAQKEYEQFRLKLQQKEHQRQRAVSEKQSVTVTIPHTSINTQEEKYYSTNPLNTPGQQSSINKAENLERDDVSPLMSLSNQNESTEKASINTKPRPTPSSAPLCSLWSTVSMATSAQKAVASSNTQPTAPSAPVKGLARFRNAATAVSVNQRIISQGVDSNDRMKNLAAAIMIKNKTTKGRVPPSFLSGGAFSWTSPRDDTKTAVPALEASHRNPDDVRIRPLQMPLRVQAEQEKKWGDLMVNVQYAVYWKVKALREDTGTLNSRQMRRLVRERPPQRRALFPGDCKTTWAMKKYVKQEVGDVLKSWQPENLRKKRSKKLIDKISLPQFIDRVRTTTSILKSFRLFNKTRDDGKDANSKQLDDDDDNDEDEYDEFEETDDSRNAGQEKEEADNTTNVIGH